MVLKNSAPVTVADVLDDRLLLGPQIPVEGFDEALYLHTGTPFSFADDG